MNPAARKIIRIGIPLGEHYAMGPGKADLLEAIQETGSIAAAGRKLGMSYRRAWLLVDEMNKCFREPLVRARLGGAKGGGAEALPGPAVPGLGRGAPPAAGIPAAPGPGGDGATQFRGDARLSVLPCAISACNHRGSGQVPGSGSSRPAP